MIDTERVNKYKWALDILEKENYFTEHGQANYIACEVLREKAEREKLHTGAVNASKVEKKLWTLYDKYEDPEHAICGDAATLLEEMNRRAQPDNPPLTLEQLRQMDGEPVWIVILKPELYRYSSNRWGILEKSISGDFGIWRDGLVLTQSDYTKTWLAYASKPEEAQSHE